MRELKRQWRFSPVLHGGFQPSARESLSSAELPQGTCEVNGNGGKCTLLPFPHEDTALSSRPAKGENAIADTSGASELKTQENLVVTEKEKSKIKGKARTQRGGR